VDTIVSLRPQLPFLKTCISIGTEVAGMLEYESLLQKAFPVEPEVSTTADDLAHIIYTTGTTGAPKGAIATRQIAVNRICNISIEHSIDPNDKFAMVFPLFHVGVYVALGYVFRAATLAILNDWDPKDFCWLVQEERIKKTNLAPVIVNFLLNWPDTAQYDLSSLQLLMYGASPMPMETLRRAMKLLPGCKLIQAYGSSETFTPVFLKPEDHDAALSGIGELAQRLGSCGRQGALSMARVVNDDGMDVQPGEVGEILLGGGLVMTGYLNKPQETAESLRDGWFHTKDLGKVDEDGYIYIVDRKNFMIITGGENVYPAQVENVLHDHPKIAEAAVLGVPDETWGEAVKAIVVVKQGERLTEEEIIEFCRPRVANYAKPKSVDLVDALPITPTGKINKLALKRKYVGSEK